MENEVKKLSTESTEFPRPALEDRVNGQPTVLEECLTRCSICEGLDHHWMPESDDEINDGEPFMVCKHCSATRPILDSDGDDE